MSEKLKNKLSKLLFKSSQNYWHKHACIITFQIAQKLLLYARSKNIVEQPSPIWNRIPYIYLLYIYYEIVHEAHKKENKV